MFSVLFTLPLKKLNEQNGTIRATYICIATQQIKVEINVVSIHIFEHVGNVWDRRTIAGTLHAIQNSSW